MGLRMFFLKLCAKGILPIVSDKIYVKLLYKERTGRNLDLKNPRTFCEKIQKLKLYDHKSSYTNMVDKIEVKKIVTDSIGKEYVIPTIGIFNSFEDIDFMKLPKQFVIKCSHDSGGIVICRDKSKFDVSIARKKIKRSLKQNYYLNGREWPYKNVRPRILIEKYMEDQESADLTDYKLYCFHGQPYYCQVIKNRQSNETIDFFDINWMHQEFTGLEKPYKPFFSGNIEKPVNYNKMIEFAQRLSEGVPFLRVDFYEINKKLYFGELTFYPAGGFGEFYPRIWNEKLGDLI